MPNNELNHGYTLTALFIEAKYAKSERQWSRYGRNGETNGGSWIQDARKRYNKAHRKASRVQLSRYQTPIKESNPVFTWIEDPDIADDYFIFEERANAYFEEYNEAIG